MKDFFSICGPRNEWAELLNVFRCLTFVLIQAGLNGAGHKFTLNP